MVVGEVEDRAQDEIGKKTKRRLAKGKNPRRTGMKTMNKRAFFLVSKD
jgi:hypothetical protein